MLAVEKLLNASPGHLGPAVRADADSYPYSYICILLVRQRFARQPRAYPELSALLGGQVPDLRGLFLRGHGGNSAELGSPQGHAMRDISSAGSISVGFGGYLTGNGIFKPVGSHGVVVIRGSWDGNWGSTAYGLDLSAGGVPVANEVRPDNQAVRFLVRARP